MTHTEAHGAMNAALKAAAGSVSIAYDGVMFTPISGSPWIRATLLPQDREGMLNNSAQWRGVYQVDLFYPKGTDFSTMYTLADTVYLAFIGKTFYNSGKTGSVRISGCDRVQDSEDAWTSIKLAFDYEFTG